MRKYSDGTVKKIISNSLIKGSGFFAHSTFSVKRGARWIRVTQALERSFERMYRYFKSFPGSRSSRPTGLRQLRQLRQQRKLVIYYFLSMYTS